MPTAGCTHQVARTVVVALPIAQRRVIRRVEARAGLVPASVFKTDDALREQRHGGFDSHALPPSHVDRSGNPRRDTRRPQRSIDAVWAHSLRAAHKRAQQFRVLTRSERSRAGGTTLGSIAACVPRGEGTTPREVVVGELSSWAILRAIRAAIANDHWHET